MRYLFALAALSALPAFAQTDVWKFSRSATLSGTAGAITVALPASGPAQQVEILDYTIQCSVDCSVTTERNGSAPTATAGVWRPEDLDTAPKDGSGNVIQPAPTVWYTSNSTGGTLSDEPFVFPAGAVIPWVPGQILLTGTGAAKNFTIRIGPLTGTFTIQLRARIRR